MTRTWKSTGTALGVMALTVGCGPANPGTGGGAPRTTGGTSGGSITIGQPFAFDQQFIPFVDATSYTTQIWASAFDPLLNIDKHLNFIPWLAKSWSWSKDHKTLTMHLQPNATWSDGKPIISDDVLLTMDFLASKAYNTTMQGQYESLVDPVIGAQDIVQGKATSFAATGGFTRVDDKTFQLHFAAPDASVLWADISSITPLPSHILKSQPFGTWASSAFNRKPTVASGPYRFVKVQGTDSVVMSANPNYWNGSPHIQQVTFQTVSADVAPGLMANGQVDLELGGLNPQDVSQMKKIGSVHAVVEPSLEFYYLGLMETHPEFQDYRVRQAVEYAIDRKGLLQGVLQGYGAVLNSPLPAQSWAAATTNDGLNPYPHDLTKAAQLLDAAGWTKNASGLRMDPVTHKPATFHILCPQDPIRQAMAMAVAQDLKQVGITVKTDPPMDINAFYNKLQSNPKSVQMYVAAWQLSDDPDPRGLWRSTDAMNYEQWKDAHNDALIQATYTLPAFNRQVRKAALVKWQLYVNQKMPLNFLVQKDEVYAVNNRLQIPDADWSIAGPLQMQQWQVTK